MRLFYAMYPFLSVCVTNKFMCRCAAVQRFSFKIPNEHAALGDGHTHTHTHTTKRKKNFSRTASKWELIEFYLLLMIQIL